MRNPHALLSVAVLLSLTPKSFAAPAMNPYQIELLSLSETLRTYYAPLEMKREAIGLDWPRTQQSLMDRAGSLRNSNDFYFLVSDLLHGMNDAHVSVRLPSTLVRELPLQMSNVEDRIIVNFIDRKKLPTDKCSVRIGDHLVTVDGKSFDELQQSQLAFRKNGNDLTNRSVFARSLSKLQEGRGVRIDPAQTSTKLEFARHDDPASKVVCDVEYKMTGVPMIGRPESGEANAPGGEDFLAFSSRMRQDVPQFDQWPNQDRRRLFKVNRLLNHVHRLFNLSSGLQELSPTAAREKSEGTQLGIGDLKPFFKLPKNFNRFKPGLPVRGIMNNKHFFAGTFKRGGKRIGFLRIPSYMLSHPETMTFTVRYFMGELDKKSDLLIIDQTNNPGGMVVLSDLIVKSLVGKLDPAKHMHFAVKPTQGFLRQYAELVAMLETEDAEGGPDMGDVLPEEVKQDFIARFKANYATVYRAFASGAALSEPVSLALISELLETVIDHAAKKVPIRGMLSLMAGHNVFKPVHYQKPVYFLINELDFSGGDATPAILQDYGRVKLVGVRTAGAGGTVEEFGTTVTSNYKYTLTTSLMVRKDGKLVENYGVQPDIEFQLKESDYRDGFKDTLTRLLETIGE